jgi:hypothetical protein
VRDGAHPSQSAAAAVTDGWTALGQGTAHVLDRIHTVAPWPLMAVTLLWLAHRHPAVYVRVAIALLLSSAAGLAVSASLRSVPVREASLARDYLADYIALPGVRASWYLLMALAVIAATPALRARVAVAAIATASVAAAVAGADHHVAGAVLGAGVPLLAWYTAGHFPSGERARRRAAVLPSRSRAEVPEPWAAPDAAPLRQAG